MNPIKIVTKTGDDGMTSTPDGKRVTKSHPNIVACGKLDTLHAQMGVANAYMKAFGNDQSWESIYKSIVDVLYKLMGEVSAWNDINYRNKYPYVCQQDIDKLEDLVCIVGETLTEQGAELSGWVYYGTSNIISAHLDLASKICREAETAMTFVQYDNGFPIHIKIRPELKIYINRLSDYLFLLSRTYENQK